MYMKFKFVAERCSCHFQSLNIHANVTPSSIVLISLGINHSLRLFTML
ncbi:hypothetical protein ALO49_200306 [Pseudomonas savastanoi pv. retacarpa]|nr:hypothetical protein ALO49_200306 [Pseudomonas savastanoi pv. retacarpa]